MSGQNGKIVSIQLLRALAAGIVAVIHIAFAYADHIGPGLGISDIGSQPAQTAVAVFFVISGYVMFVSSRNLPASPAATRTFWTRRCVRILPPYWAATILLVVITLILGRSVDGTLVATSMMLLPTDTPGFQGRPEFFLWPGWTLVYEMVFYFVFGIGLRWGKFAAAAFASAAIVAGVVSGVMLEPENPFLISVSRPVMLIFIFGIALAVFRGSGRNVSRTSRWIALALSIASYISAPPPQDGSALDFAYVAWAGIPAALLSVAVLGGPIRIPFPRLVDRLGDASYAVYLLHVPLAIATMSTFPLQFGAWPFFAFSMLVIYIASLLFFSGFERPVTRWLNGRLSSPNRSDRLLQETAV